MHGTRLTGASDFDEHWVLSSLRDLSILPANDSHQNRRKEDRGSDASQQSV